jgi:hypothetical protein
VAAAVLALVLALEGSALEQKGSLWLDRRVTHKLPQVVDVAAEVPPREDVLAGGAHVGAELQALVEQKSLLVLVAAKSVDGVALALLKQILLALLVCALDDELVLELLAGAADSGGGVLEDELRVALDGARADEVQLALWNLYEGLFGRVTKDDLADCAKNKALVALCCSVHCYGGGGANKHTVSEHKHGEICSGTRGLGCQLSIAEESTEARFH